MKEQLNQPVLILGYGIEGQSVHRYLHKRFPKLAVGIADQKKVNPTVSPAKVYSGSLYLKSIRDFKVIVRSPGISPYLPELQQAENEGSQVTSATNIFFSECPGVTIGVTGTKGKSTTATLTAQILKQHHPDVRLVGNVGEPALDHLEGAKKDTVFVVELSSHQLSDCRYSPHIAVILNIVPEHLDYYKNLNQYVTAKSRIVSHQTEKDIVIFNPRHTHSASIAEAAMSQKFRFSQSPGSDFFCWVDHGVIYAQKTGTKVEQLFPVKDIPILGPGNLENTLAAVCVGLILKVPVRKIHTAVKGFKGLEHRLELVGEFSRIKFYNDSLATIPEATINALEALGNDVITLIVGGFDRGLSFQSLGQAIADSSIKNLILLPDTGAKIAQVLKLADPQTSIVIIPVSSMEEAVKKAFEKTPPGHACLMSPASASFNLFKDYSERGDLFKKWIRKLGTR